MKVNSTKSNVKVTFVFHCVAMYSELPYGSKIWSIAINLLEICFSKEYSGLFFTPQVWGQVIALGLDKCPPV